MNTNDILVDKISYPNGVSEVITLNPDGTYREEIRDEQGKTFVHTGVWKKFEDTRYLPANYAAEPHVLIKQWIDADEVSMGKRPPQIKKIDNVRSLNCFKKLY